MKTYYFISQLGDKREFNNLSFLIKAAREENVFPINVYSYNDMDIASVPLLEITIHN